jgi:hypothetical protein
MQNVKFNRGFKGKCRWERGYWSRKHSKFTVMALVAGQRVMLFA